jgi:hypothetical protein
MAARESLHGVVCCRLSTTPRTNERYLHNPEPSLEGRTSHRKSPLQPYSITGLTCNSTPRYGAPCPQICRMHRVSGKPARSQTPPHLPNAPQVRTGPDQFPKINFPDSRDTNEQCRNIGWLASQCLCTAAIPSQLQEAPSAPRMRKDMHALPVPSAAQVLKGLSNDHRNGQSNSQ